MNLQGFSIEFVFHNGQQEGLNLFLPGLQLIINNFYLFHLLSADAQIFALLDNLPESILTHFLAIIPEEIASCFHIIQGITSNTHIACISFSLMFLYPNTLNMEPFLASAFALHHCSIFVRLTKTANTIFLWILYQERSWNLSIQQSLSSLNLFNLISLIFLSLACNRCIAIFSIPITSFLPFLGFLPNVLIEK